MIPWGGRRAAPERRAGLRARHYSGIAIGAPAGRYTCTLRRWPRARNYGMNHYVNIQEYQPPARDARTHAERPASPHACMSARDARACALGGV
eukprot:scaffold52_cov290-Prasinococcus_capsulatus_cf.AAC.8